MFSDYVEQMAFPTLFPKGINRLRTPRKQNETVLQYFQSRHVFCVAGSPISHIYFGQQTLRKNKNFQKESTLLQELNPQKQPGDKHLSQLDRLAKVLRTIQTILNISMDL